MNIDGPNAPLAPPGAARIARDGAPAPAHVRPARDAEARPSPRDTVSISDDARRLSAAAADVPERLAADRAAQVRERLLSGAYHSVEMAGLVAQRILESGDV